MKFNGKITYTIDKNHPDIEYVQDWNENKLFSFSDTYTFNSGMYSAENAIAYIKKDLKLVAGGGYNSKHIHNVSFDITRI